MPALRPCAAHCKMLFEVFSHLLSPVRRTKMAPSPCHTNVQRNLDKVILPPPAAMTSDTSSCPGERTGSGGSANSERGSTQSEIRTRDPLVHSSTRMNSLSVGKSRRP